MKPPRVPWIGQNRRRPARTLRSNSLRFQRAQLSNGLKIILAERHSIPLVSFKLQVDAGYAADQFALPGTANLTMQMLDEGTARRTAIQISDQLNSLGANLDAGSDLDMCQVNLSTLNSTLDSALDIYADVILNPTFPESDFKRLQQQLLATIQREKTEPVPLSLRVLPPLIYGSGHAYGNPLTGSGTEASVSKLTVADFTKVPRHLVQGQQRHAHCRWRHDDRGAYTQVGEIIRSVEIRRSPRKKSRQG